MALDKNFLKYKLEKIKNDEIYKSQDSKTKKAIRKENSKKSAREAEAIHSYLTGIDTIRPFMNRSFIDPDSMPGNLAIDEKTFQLNVTQAKTASAPKLPMLPGLLGGVSNAQKSKGLKILKRIFDSLNIVFKPKKLSIDKDFESKGQVNVGKNIIISGNGYINKDLVVRGDGEVGGNLLVKRGGTINNNLLVKKDVSVEKNIIIGENANVSKNLNVRNDEFIGGNLSVEKNENIRGNLNVGNDGVVGENLSVGNNIDISGNSKVGGSLNVTKISNTMGIHNVGLGLNVMGPTILGGGVIIAPFPIPPIPGMTPPRRNKNSGNLTVKGNIIGSKKLTLSGNMSVGGNGIIGGDVRVAKSVNVDQDINLRGNGNVNGDLSVAGDTFVGDTFVGGNGNVNGDLSVGGILNVGESSTTQNGYTYLPNGIILQWGTATSNSDDIQSFEFPLVFPNACFNVVTQRRNGDVVDVLPVTSISTTNFQINRSASIDGSHSFYWQALGN